MENTNNLRIGRIQAVTPVKEIMDAYPITSAAAELTAATRRQIQSILSRQDPRLLVVLGPCSIHDPNAAIEYGQHVREARARFGDALVLVMRVYFEKPRTRVGWKGLINDPNIDGSFDINRGLALARELLLKLTDSGVPAGCEFLDMVTGQYFSDLVSWGAIGARTTESQVHREMASGLSCPVGFKNGTDGNLDIAIDAVFAAAEPHIFLSPTETGQMAIFSTLGNPDGHIILRGGKQSNYDAASVAQALSKLQEAGLNESVMIDFSHANSQKQYQRQISVGEDVAAQIASGQQGIVGVMIESHLNEGRQNVVNVDELAYGVSITDACLSWAQTEPVLATLANAVRQRQR